MSTRSRSRSSKSRRTATAPENQPESRPTSSRVPQLSTGAEPSESNAASKPPPGLYLVATPIGNLEDITLRALRILATVDVIACEDSRVTRKLLQAHGIETGLIAYHDHNAANARPAIIKRLKCGEAVALVSDAGTPLISDPGYKLVREAAAAGIRVTALPGASATLAGLAVSGLPSDRFFFAGFSPNKSVARRRGFRELADLRASLIFYESPRRLAACLKDMASELGTRPAAVARELTKLFEEVRRGRLDELALHYAEAGAPKGEVVIVVGPPEETAAPPGEAVDAALRQALRSMRLRDAATAVAATFGLARREVYARALALNETAGGDDAD